MDDLPDYERPPVTEVAVAVQFVPVPTFGMREAVAVARAFDGWDLLDVVPALGPIVEPPPGQAAVPGLQIGLGSWRPRVILGRDQGLRLAQVQQDRVAAQQKLGEQPPRFSAASAQLREVVTQASAGLGVELLDAPHAAELVEVIYDNTIRAGEGWGDFAQLHEVLRLFSSAPGEPPFDRVEQAQAGLTYLLHGDDQFAGRLRVSVEPITTPGQPPALRLLLIARRLVRDRDLELVLADSHGDIVKVFTAVTTDRMHDIWGRIR